MNSQISRVPVTTASPKKLRRRPCHTPNCNAWKECCSRRLTSLELFAAAINRKEIRYNGRALRPPVILALQERLKAKGEITLCEVHFSLKTRISVNAQRCPCVERAEKVFMKGSLRLVTDVTCWVKKKPSESLMLIAADVHASMKSSVYRTCILFQTSIGSMIMCKPARSYCTCHYGFSGQCGHIAALLLTLGTMQGVYTRPRYVYEDCLYSMESDSFRRAVAERVPS